MNRPRKKMLKIGIALVAFLILLPLAFHRNEPIARGKPFSYWLNRLNHPAAIGIDAGIDEAEAAITEMGSNAAVPLVHELERKDSAWDSYYWKFYYHRYQSFPAWLINILPEPIEVGQRQALAAQFLNNLGLKARCAIPEMLAAYNRDYLAQYNLPSGKNIDWVAEFEHPPEHKNQDPTLSPLRLEVIHYLRLFGANSEIVPMWLAAAQEQEANEKANEIMLWFASPSVDQSAAIENSKALLIEASTNKNSNVRLLAVEMLSRLRPDEPGLTAALLNSASDTNHNIGVYSFLGLIRAPLDFQSALPIFGRFINDNDSFVAAQAKRALLNTTGRGQHLFSSLKATLFSADPAMRLAALQVLRSFPEQARADEIRIRELSDFTLETNLQVRAEAQTILNQLLADPESVGSMR